MANALNQQDLTAEIVKKLDELPTLPAIVYELSKVINDPMSSTADVEKIMANDQSLTTKVLRLANSAYYAIPGGVSSLQRAISYIGYDTIQQLVLSASVIKALEVKGPSRFDLNEFWKHSMGVAMASEAVARFVGYRTPGDLFTCGLIHDMGKVATFVLKQDLFLEMVDACAKSGLSFSEIEVKNGYPRHAKIGAELAIKWKLPTIMQAVISFHHIDKHNQRGPLSNELHLVVDIVFLANLLIHALGFGNSGHLKVNDLPKDVMSRLKLDTEKIKELILKVQASLASAEGFLKIIGG